MIWPLYILQVFFKVLKWKGKVQLASDIKIRQTDGINFNEEWTKLSSCKSSRVKYYWINMRIYTKVFCVLIGETKTIQKSISFESRWADCH